MRNVTLGADRYTVIRMLLSTHCQAIASST